MIFCRRVKNEHSKEKAISETISCPVRITVESVKGECPLGNRVGDEFIIHETTPEGMCLGAFA